MEPTSKREEMITKSFLNATNLLKPLPSSSHGARAGRVLVLSLIAQHFHPPPGNCWWWRCSAGSCRQGSVQSGWQRFKEEESLGRHPMIPVALERDLPGNKPQNAKVAVVKSCLDHRPQNQKRKKVPVESMKQSWASHHLRKQWLRAAEQWNQWELPPAGSPPGSLCVS